MVVIDGVKYACDRCIRGHRVSGCFHTDAPLTMIKPKGRPSTHCSHCKEARLSRNAHVRCNCKVSKGHTKNCRCSNSKNCICTYKGKTKLVLNPEQLQASASSYGSTAYSQMSSGAEQSRSLQSSTTDNYASAVGAASYAAGIGWRPLSPLGSAGTSHSTSVTSQEIPSSLITAPKQACYSFSDNSNAVATLDTKYYPYHQGAYHAASMLGVYNAPDYAPSSQPMSLDSSAKKNWLYNVGSAYETIPDQQLLPSLSQVTASDLEQQQDQQQPQPHPHQQHSQSKLPQQQSPQQQYNRHGEIPHLQSYPCHPVYSIPTPPQYTQKSFGSLPDSVHNLSSDWTSVPFSAKRDADCGLSQSMTIPPMPKHSQLY